MPYCSDTQISRVRLLSKDISHAAYTTSLQLLKDIDVTVDVICNVQRCAEDQLTKVEKLTEALKARGGSVIDRDSAIADLMEEAEQQLKLVVAVLHAKMGAAYRDPALQGDDEDAVVSEYKAAIEVVPALHNAMVELRWAVLEHDADLEEPSEEVFDSPEALMRELKKA